MDEKNILTTKDIVKEIKRSFRLLMNGVTAQSMRDKGMNYHINWGHPYPICVKWPLNTSRITYWHWNYGKRMCANVKSLPPC